MILIPDDMGVPMESALDARGQVIVREFLATLLTYHDQMGRGKVKVGQFLKQYMLSKCGGYAGHQEKAKKNRFWTKAKVLQAIELHKTMEWKEVGKVLGVSGNAASSTVHDYLKFRRDYY